MKWKKANKKTPGWLAAAESRERRRRVDYQRDPAPMGYWKAPSARSQRDRVVSCRTGYFDTEYRISWDD